MTPSKFLSSLTALSLLMTASACAEADVPAETTPSLASEERALASLTVAIDEEESATDSMTAFIDGKQVSLDELAKALGDQTATGREIYAAVDGGREYFVEGSSGAVTASAVRLDGFKKISETSLKTVAVRAFFAAPRFTVELRFTVLPSSDAAVREGFAEHFEDGPVEARDVAAL